MILSTDEARLLDAVMENVLEYIPASDLEYVANRVAESIINN